MTIHGLNHLLETTGHNLDAVPYDGWVKKLSPGEKQIFAFLRLFYHKPSLAFLDEATSALCVEAETKLYQGIIHVLRQLLKGGGGVVSSVF